MVHLEAAVELLSAGRQQLDVCGTEEQSGVQKGSQEVSRTDRKSAGKATDPIVRLASPELTTRGVNGIPQFSVLPLAQLVLLGTSCCFRGLNLWTSDTPRGEERRRSEQQLWGIK